MGSVYEKEFKCGGIEGKGNEKRREPQIEIKELRESEDKDSQ